jgi:hypothetical protein
MPAKKSKPRKKSKKEPKYLEANGLRIKDLNGRIRALLVTDSPDGRVSFNLYGDPDTQVAISAGPEGYAGMDLIYGSKMALSVGVCHGESGITICDHLGRPSFFIVAGTEEGCGRIRIYHEGKLIGKPSDDIPSIWRNSVNSV